MRRALLPLLAASLLAIASGAAAQVRPIPENTKIGTVRHLEAMVIEIDGKPQQLAPGAQIRDVNNRLMLPVSLPEREKVRYLVDSMGMVYRVWLLSDEEKANLPPPPSPFPK